MSKILDSVYLKVVLIFIIILQLLIDFYGLSLFPVGPINYNAFGTVGQWFSGMLTVVAVIIAFKSLSLSMKEIKRIIEEKKISEIKESGDLYCWLEYKVDKVSGEYVGINLMVLNLMNHPIYEWRIYIQGMSEVISDQDSAGNIRPFKNIIELNDKIYNYVRKNKKIPMTRIEFVATNGEVLERNYYGKLNVVK